MGTSGRAVVGQVALGLATEVLKKASVRSVKVQVTLFFSSGSRPS